MLKRLYIYQKERFPLVINGVLSFFFTICTQLYAAQLHSDKLNWKYALSTWGVVFLFFLLIRIIDEFKDFESDALHRSHLPLHRGVISKKELLAIGSIGLVAQLLILLVFIPQTYLYYLLVWAFLIPMSFEFFVSKKLHQMPVLYAGSHMLIMPLVDLFASSGHWAMSNYSIHSGIWILMLVSYFNGFVLEISRKTKAAENIEINSYNRIMSNEKCIQLLNFMLLACLISAFYLPFGHVSTWYFASIGLTATLLGLIAALFVRNPNPKNEKLLEVFSGVWMLVLYGSIGFIPFLS